LFRNASCGSDVPLKSCISPRPSFHCPQTLQFFIPYQLCHFKNTSDTFAAVADEEDEDGEDEDDDKDDDDDVGGNITYGVLHCVVEVAADAAVDDDDALN
jgi:hypothetical protein